MKKILLLLILLSVTFGKAQKLQNIQSGEKLSYRIHYGLLNAGIANLTTLKTTYKGQPHYYVKGYGKTTGAVRAFFKVEDHYQSFIDKTTSKPYQFLRKIDEGGYTKNQEGFFNQDSNSVLVKDYKNNAILSNH